MTKKQEYISQAALELFTEENYSNTSTSRIADCINVTEGLFLSTSATRKGCLKMMSFINL